MIDVGPTWPTDPAHRSADPDSYRLLRAVRRELQDLMAVAVATFAHPSTEIERRARLALEANLAAEALAYDASDYVLDAEGCLGSLEDRQATRESDWKSAPQPWKILSEDGISILRRTFNSPGSQEPTCVDYFRQGSQLIRRVAGPSPSSSVVADHVVDFTASACDVDGEDSPSGNCVKVVLTMAYDPEDPAVARKGNCSANYVLIAVPPP